MFSIFSIRQSEGDCEPLKRQVQNLLFMYECCDSGNPELCFCCLEAKADDIKCKKALKEAEKAQEELKRCLEPTSISRMTEQEIRQGIAIIKYLPTTRSQYYKDPVVPTDIMKELAKSSLKTNTLIDVQMDEEGLLKSLCEALKNYIAPNGKLFLDCRMPEGTKSWPYPPHPNAPIPSSGEMPCPDCLKHAFRCGPDYTPPPPKPGNSAAPYDKGYGGCLQSILHFIQRGIQKKLSDDPKLGLDLLKIPFIFDILSNCPRSSIKRCAINKLLRMSPGEALTIIYEILDEATPLHRGAAGIKQWLERMLEKDPDFLKKFLERLRESWGEPLPPSPSTPNLPPLPQSPLEKGPPRTTQ